MTLITGRSNQTTLIQDRFVLDGTIEAIGQLFTLAPGLTAILRTNHPAFPTGYVRTDLEVDTQFTVGHLVDNRVPTSLTVIL